MKFSWIRKLVIVAMLVLQVQTAYGVTPEDELASLKQSLSDVIQDAEISQCVDSLTPLYDLELLEFLRFLETNFQNKSSNSSLNKIAIARFASFRNNLTTHFAAVNPNLAFDAENLTREELNAYNGCRTLTNAYIDMGKEMMINHIKSNTAQKQTTVMIEKYKAINDRLREMHLDFSRTYAMLNTFKDKLPGFLRQCIVN